MQLESDTPRPADAPGPAPILAIAAAQGLVLYGLHLAIEGKFWPATQLALLPPLYLLALLLPLTAQLLIRHRHDRALWLGLAVMGVVLAAIGAYFGAALVPGAATVAAQPDLIIASALPLLVLWLVSSAFLRARLESGHWRPPYPALFAAAWRNKLTLLEAGVFVALFWGLLLLWGALFNTLQIYFFRELFTTPLFIYPATALALGFALHLIGSIDRLVDVLLTQVLNLLKWLAPLAGLIVALFAIALLPRLPDLFANAQRPLSAVALLWIVALTLLLLNAAYQDGRAERPWGSALSTAMRIVPPLMLVIALTALYAVWVRIDSVGFTVSRYWGLVTAAMATTHALAYAWAALRGGPWMQGISRANPLLAAVLCATLLLSLSPLLSPYRLSAASQGRIALTTQDLNQRDSALSYLRFNAGEPGLEQLRTLAARTGSAQDVAFAAVAGEWLRRPAYWEMRELQPEYTPWREALRVYPTDRALPSELEAPLRAAVEKSALLQQFAGTPTAIPAALWVDLAGDAELELLVTTYNDYLLFTRRDSTWVEHSRGSLYSRPVEPRDWDAALAAGEFGAADDQLRDLRIGAEVLRLLPAKQPAQN
jgi:hypothetical protein